MCVYVSAIKLRLTFTTADIYYLRTVNKCKQIYKQKSKSELTYTVAEAGCHTPINLSTDIGKLYECKIRVIFY